MSGGPTPQPRRAPSLHWRVTEATPQESPVWSPTSTRRNVSVQTPEVSPILSPSITPGPATSSLTSPAGTPVRRTIVSGVSLPRRVVPGETLQGKGYGSETQQGRGYGGGNQRRLKTAPGEGPPKRGHTPPRRGLQRSDTFDSLEGRGTPRRNLAKNEVSIGNKKSVSLNDISNKSPRVTPKMGRRNKKGELINVDFTPAEWNISNLSKYKKADFTRQRSEAIRNEAAQLIEEHEDYTKKNVEAAEYRLDERVKDTEFWKQELGEEVEKNKEETELLIEARRNLDHALAQTDRPLRVNTKCRDNRERRIGIDRVRDRVEISLVQEADNVRKNQDVMKDLITECSLQIEANTAAQHQLVSDLTNKDQAINIDQAAQAISNPPRSFGGGKETLEAQATQGQLPGRRTHTWAKHTQYNVQTSHACRCESQKLRSKVSNFISGAVTEMKTLWNSTTQALMERISEMQATQKMLQQHLNRTLQEIKDQEKHIEQLRGAIRGKGQPLKIAQARIAMRGKLPADEACLDTAHIMLLEEVAQIEESINKLQNTQDKAQAVHNDLVRMKGSLEHDIFIKTNSLMIDRTKCLPIRSEFPFHMWCGCKKCKTCRTSQYCRTRKSQK